MKNIYVDGQHGTTGIEIKKYIAKHPDLSLVEIDYEMRHDLAMRKMLMNASDAVVLCLPENASKEAVELIESPKIIVVDTSTAFRTDDEWTYGLPELGEEHKNNIVKSKRISNPGCHATASLIAILPLQKSSLLKKDIPLTLISHTGYSGGGKEMIEVYKNSKKQPAAQHYALGQSHKHLPEIMKYGNLEVKPIFLPIVCNYERGILLSLPLHEYNFTKKASLNQIYEIFKEYYKDFKFAKVHAPNSSGAYLHGEVKGGNEYDIFINGTDETFQLSVRIDNLGKGASGAAIQSLNLVFGFPEKSGLK